MGKALGINTEKKELFFSSREMVVDLIVEMFCK
jgi:hypothetical protein